MKGQAVTERKEDGLFLVRRSESTMPSAKPIAVATGADTHKRVLRMGLVLSKRRRKRASQAEYIRPPPRSDKSTVTNAVRKKEGLRMLIRDLRECIIAKKCDKTRSLHQRA
jgi:hypothetical protein